MASKVKASTALFLSLNLLFFALVSSHTSDGSSATNYRNPVLIRPGATSPSGISPEGHGQSGTYNPLNLSVCAKLLGGLVDIELGDLPTRPCCSLIHGLVDLEAVVCLCTAIRANVLGIISLELPISLSLLLSNCGRNPPVEYLCGP